MSGRGVAGGEQWGSTASRLVVYVVATLVGSSVGSLFTHRSSSTWADANPVTASLAGVWSLGVAAVIAAFAALTRLVVAAAAGAFAAAMIAMWWAFASSESSTAAFVFFYGWLFGVPAATMMLIVASWRRRPRSPS